MDNLVRDVDAIAGTYAAPRPVGRDQMQTEGFVGVEVNPVFVPGCFGYRDGAAHAFLLADIVLGHFEGVNAIGGKARGAGRRVLGGATGQRLSVKGVIGITGATPSRESFPSA